MRIRNGWICGLVFSWVTAVAVSTEIPPEYSPGIVDSLPVEFSLMRTVKITHPLTQAVHHVQASTKFHENTLVRKKRFWRKPRHTIVVNYAGEGLLLTTWIRRGPDGRWGIHLGTPLASNDPFFTIVGVVPKSFSAIKHLATGDKLLAVEGIWLAPLTLEQATTYFQTVQKDTVQLLLYRGDIAFMPPLFAPIPEKEAS